MQISIFFSMIMFAAMEVLRTQFSAAYGLEPKDSLEFVGFVACFLLIMCGCVRCAPGHSTAAVLCVSRNGLNNIDKNAWHRNCAWRTPPAPVQSRPWLLSQSDPRSSCKTTPCSLVSVDAVHR